MLFVGYDRVHGADLWTLTEPVHPWRNVANELDVNADGTVALSDALTIINCINVSGDQNVAPTDAQIVISWPFEARSAPSLQPVFAG